VEEELQEAQQDRHKREENEFGLAEMDGVPRWLGAKRRKWLWRR
jgi:hypothetical protein